MDAVAQQLRNAPEGLDDYVEYLELVLHGVDELEDEGAVFAEAFLFFERNAQADLGIPGPLVHFLERFYPRYVEHLKASVHRKPTRYTVWLLNRILNAPIEEGFRNSLLAALEAASTNPAALPLVREEPIDSCVISQEPANKALHPTRGSERPIEGEL
jgi:hypothetical protein